MSESEKPKVAFLGPEASYTHQATLDTFSPTQYTLTPQPTIEDVFTAVQNGTAHRGVVPFENSTNGSVVFTLDLFADPHSKHRDILVCGEAYVGVSHCLLGPASASPPDYAQITKLYSHPQAWGQCNAFLQKHLKHAERFDVSSTSRAAQIVAAAGDSGAAAISSKVAGTLFGLAVRAEAINDAAGNQTRFLVLRRRDGPAPPATPSAEESSRLAPAAPDADREFKTLLLFTLPYAPQNPNPGALAQCLSVFGRHKLDLTSINTRPSGVANWEYVFFIEFRGRREEGEGGEVNAALRELGEVSPSSTMAPRKRRQRSSLHSTRAKRANLSRSPRPQSQSPQPPSQRQSPWSDVPGSAPTSGIQTPDGVQLADRVRRVSPPPGLSTTVTTRRTSSSASHKHAGPSRGDAFGEMATSSPFMEWLEMHMGSYDVKRRLSEQLQEGIGSGKDAAVGDVGQSSEAHNDSTKQGDQSPVRYAEDGVSPTHVLDDGTYMMSGALPIGTEQKNIKSASS
ncbi:Prephenate dehydratase-domain-containing protein [Boeremia exigua]|uniref:Prephenate dehydratase-domain-containing protein n=1 Tax=Boeremia exigua TaxID=749465 RepID=UPI001E8DBBC2|nr:Prephenate dehydratase-domain-containing protein [Boeremia exigua]KAH6622401.1 Prephenate dehydratase-domain-containing protein [Boeremia exigua]